MATLALAAIGAAIGAAVIPAGITVLGATITGAAIGQAIGAAIGSYVDATLFGSSGQSNALEGPRLEDLRVLSSAEGVFIPRVYGRARIGANVIWATKLKEVVRIEKKGGVFGVGDAKIKTYEYFANLAVAICEGEIIKVGRIWADGKEMNTDNITFRVYKGTETQTADSLIESVQGAANAPTYRGVAYVVFDNMPLKDFNNHVPQLTFEVFRNVDDLSDKLNAITIIPATGEFAYEPNIVVGSSVTELFFLSFLYPNVSGLNVNTRLGGTDWSVSLDQFQATFTSADTVSLFSAWFGDDLRCGNCLIKPKITSNIQSNGTFPLTWEVAGVSAAQADTISQIDDRPAFGGSPNESSLIAAIVDLHDRGINCILTPFLLMDIADGNSLDNPYGGTGQPVYPWRGRITCNPAPGVSGTVDQTAAAATQVNSFYGTVTAADFTVTASNVSYNGPNEWTYSRFILHHAAICKAAGLASGKDVDAFVIGSEQKYLTFVRDTSGASFPFVTKLIALAAEVKILLPNTKVTYASDWSEFTPFQTSQFGGTSGEIFFHLDDLWSDANIDAIGIDNYWPLSDWREGENHLDFIAGYNSIYELDYLRSNIEGGEGYDFFYASTTERNTQTRTTITDSEGKPWVFRFKDIKNWWQEQHFNRPGAVEDAVATSWVPEEKQIWFTELGCPAINKGSNQPNVFYDPKSSESEIPYFSNGIRDDFIQRSFLKAHLDYYNPNSTDYVSGSNPLSSTYNHRMVDIEYIMVYTWDSRPYPAFPNNEDTWSDADNWTFGHWLSGRSEDAPVSGVVQTMFSDYNFADFTTPDIIGMVSGYYITSLTSFRDAVQPLEVTYLFDTYESEGTIKTQSRALATKVATVTLDDVVEVNKEEPRFTNLRVQETDIPQRAKGTFSDPDNDYQNFTVEAIKISTGSDRVATVSAPIVLRRGLGQELVSRLLYEQWGAREKLTYALPPSLLKVEASDIVTLTTNARSIQTRVTHLRLGESLVLEGLSYDRTLYEAIPATDVRRAVAVGVVHAQPVAAFLDLPLYDGVTDEFVGYFGAYTSPFSSIVLYRSSDALTYTLNIVLQANTTMGATTTALYSGVTSRYDKANTLRVAMFDSNVELASVTDLELLGGANKAALYNADAGLWEIIQFRDVSLVSAGVYDLSYLLRGQYGTEDAIGNPIPIGSTFVLLDESIFPVDMTIDDVGLSFSWKYGPSDRDISDVSYGTENHAYTGRGLKPFSPIHVKGSFSGTEFTITWIRRTRKGGDNWNLVEVPLSEDSESYEVDILDGETVVRTLSSTTTSVTYTAEQQVTDFGSIQSSYTVDVYQLSATLGRGTPRRAVIP